jgi:hypothetical protein
MPMIAIIFLHMAFTMVGYLLEILEVLVPIFLQDWNDDLFFYFELKIVILIGRIWLAWVFHHGQF